MDGQSAALAGIAIYAVTSNLSTWPWSMFAAIFGGLSLLTLWYVNFLRPQWTQRARKAATKTYFLVPSKAQHDCSYATQSDDEHLLKELSLPPDTEMVIDFVMHTKTAISYSEFIVGFMGDLDKKPYFTKYNNRYVNIGRGREVDPALQTDDDFIDKHFYYHRKVAKSVSAGTVLSSAFTIKTRSPGLYPLHILFVSDEPFGEEFNLFVTVEQTPTIKMRCVEPKHLRLECARNGLLQAQS